MSTITALLVDDEPKAIERLAGLLESFPGIDVIVLMSCPPPGRLRSAT